MWTKLAFAVPTVIVSLVLTFAPVLAQESRDLNRDNDVTANESDDRDDPNLGWLGLIGLVGLGGLLRRDRVDRNRVERDHADRSTHR
jgi:MYXO-CTERM domain-containing protein